MQTTRKISRPDLDTLAALFATDAERDPRAALAVAEHLRRAAHTVEQAAIRAALARERWFETPAATLLGLPRQSLQRKMAPDLATEAREQRGALGYRSGPRPQEPSAASASERPTPLGGKR